MTEAEQFVIDYMEGRTESKAFIDRLKADPGIEDWLQSIVPEGKIGYYEILHDEAGRPYFRTGPYDVRQYIDRALNAENKSNLQRHLDVFGIIARLLKEAFPERQIRFDTSMKKKFNFLLKACPDYLYSRAIEESGIFEKLMKELPTGWSEQRKVKEFRKRIREMFYIEGQNYPRWFHVSEWPLSPAGKPTKFLKQRNSDGGDVVKYKFLDPETGKEIEVVQNWYVGVKA